VRGLVTEVPIEPNRPIKKGDALFKVDPTPFGIAVKNHEAQIARLRVQLLSAEASSRNLEEQLKGAIGQKEAIDSKLKLSRLRLEQYKELADSGAGNRFETRIEALDPCAATHQRHAAPTTIQSLLFDQVHKVALYQRLPVEAVRTVEQYFVFSRRPAR